jgi:membrane-bound lytic murein transglycosylase A
VRRTALAAAALVAATLASGCGLFRLRPPPPLVEVGSRAMPSLSDDLDPGSLRLAVQRTMPAYAGDPARAEAARRLLAILDATPDPDARRAAIAAAFRVVRIRDPLLLTAYYEPEIAGRLAPDATYRLPIYGRPPDLIDVDPAALDPRCHCRRTAGRVDGGALHPYPTRAEIDAGALAGRGLEIAWAADPVDLFSLHIQGSGLLRLPDGRRLGVRFAATNGRQYRSIGRMLLERRLLPPGRASMEDIRGYLESLPPEEQAAVLEWNERFTLFRLANGGITGSLGVELTPGRTVATDPTLVPPGALGYLVTPGVRRFVVSQDTGGAVVGAHADLFLGAGPEAEARAGRTRERGALYLLLPREPTPRAGGGDSPRSGS